MKLYRQLDVTKDINLRMMAIYLTEKNRTEYAQKKPKTTPFEYNLDVNIICDNMESK